MVLELRSIQKCFGGVQALRSGDLRVAAGEVHLLLGENGAGKSTLMKIVAGMQAADSGEVIWKGQPVRFRNPAEAQRAGIGMVHQESLLAPHLSVAENIYLGREPRRGLGWVDRPRAVRDAARLIDEHRFPLRAEQLVGSLSPAGRQMVEICRAVAQGASLLIFDEPTSSLSDAESQEVFRIVRGLRDRGASVIYITHRMEELRELGGRVTVLRDGETVFTGAMAEVSTPELIRHMVGRSVETIYRREPLAPGREMLRVEKLSRRGVLHDVSLTLRAGEIVGLAGLIGAGRTELCRCLFGVDRAESGSVHVEGRAVRIRSPRDAVRAGLALIPEDRQKEGLAAGLPVRDNVLMASMQQVSRFGFLDSARVRSLVGPGGDQRAGQLSGGNQQKVVIRKWVLSGAKVVLFDEPARGIDVGAKVDVFAAMDRMARDGAAVLMVSSELTELMQVADRILVMRHGRITAELPRGATQEEIMRHAALESLP
ncbi:MAG TPA: sugar ABC transporter ATP-binding protein [Paludibaculum sp.]|jgi:ABC-type sugar transport system ATPase subunit